MAWYGGQAMGTAIAEVLFGVHAPGGRLPVTFYASHTQLPPFEDYAMTGRTYRYFDGRPAYPFGHGLSYTTFDYGAMSVPAVLATGEGTTASVEVHNTGAVAGDEVVQLYVRDAEASVPVPRHALKAFQRIHLAAGGVEDGGAGPGAGA